MGLTAVAAYGRGAGSARVRLFDWLDYLSLRVDERTYTNESSLSIGTLLRHPMRTLSAEFLLRRLTADSSVFISRRASPLSTGKLESQILKSARHGVYDFDDALWVRDRGLFPLRDVWMHSVETADVVIAGNPMLAQKAFEFSDRVVMIPSCVNPDQYVPKATYDIATPTAVWIGSPSTEKYLSLIVEPLLALNADIGLRLKLISAGSGDLGRLESIVDRTTWNRASFGAELAAGDVGIMPLPDDPWARGKCAYKILQYGAAALPVVASPVGANADALAKLSGRAAVTAEEWYDEIRYIAELPSHTRAVVGAESRRGVLECFSYAAWSAAWTRAVIPNGGPLLLD